MPIVPMILGGVAQGLGSWFGAQEQSRSAQQAMDLQRQMWEQQQQQQAPWMQAGQSTLADLLRQMQAGAFEVDPSQLANDPGYQFRLAQGQKALERSAAARGSLNSGGTLKSLARYSQGVASDELHNAWQRKQGAFQRMAQLAGMGQGATNNLGAMGGQYANNMSGLYGAQGNANAAGWMGGANAASNTLSDIAGMGMAGLSMGMGGMPNFGGAPGGQRLPTQGGQSTGYAANYRPPGGFGLGG